MYVNLPLSGVGHSTAGTIRTMVNLQIKSKYEPEFSLRVNALVIKNITGMIPRSTCSIGNWPHIQNKTLADPTFDHPGRIDILLGADIYKKIILPGVIHGDQHSPVAQRTVFGWILSGELEATHRVNINPSIFTHHSCIDIDIRLKTFWEIEDVSINQSHLTAEKIQCEEHYANTHSKSSDGRYVVRLPLHSSSSLLGESRTSAMNRFLQIERSFTKKPTQKASYIEFMNEYISLGHMKVVESISNSKCYVIPHHAVFKESSSTTKTRVVFDASNKTSSGHSLNDMLLNGPKIQDDLSTILLRWRKYPVAVTSDVEKMYRQILVHPNDQHMQHIFWRNARICTSNCYVRHILCTISCSQDSSTISH